MSAPRALVTGAAGFMGSHVAGQCLELGMHVVAVDDLSGGFKENVPAGAEWAQGDLRDVAFVESLFQAGSFDYVYHLAAYAAEGLSHFIRRYNYRTNLEASVNLINQSLLGEVRRFVFTSSIAVYGAGQLPMREDMTPMPEDPYGVSKYAVELDMGAASHMFGLEFTVFRPHNVYGERQNISDPYRNVIGIFMNNVMRGRPMTVFGDGRQTRAFSHIACVAPPIARAPLVPESANEVFNVGADEPYDVLTLANTVAAAFDVEPDIVHLPARNEVVDAYSDHSKAVGVFGEPPTVTLQDGIERMARWARETGPREPVRFAEPIEVGINLPPSWAELTREQ